jgi:NTE family protein
MVSWWERIRKRIKPSPPVIGLALGGGFARGLAHLGVLKVLEENRIPVHMVAGTSAGSIIGGAWAAGRNVPELIAGAQSVRFRDFAAWTISRMGLASNERMERFVRGLFPVHQFERTRIPLAVTATDLLTGEGVVFGQGDLIAPIRASCAYPGLFTPVTIGRRTLIDGAFSNPLPVGALRERGATHIIAVHVGGAQRRAVPGNLFQVVHHCFSLMQERIGAEWRRHAHVIVEPQLEDVDWDDFGKASRIIAAGEAAARAALPRIQGWLEPALPAAVTLQQHRQVLGER